MSILLEALRKSEKDQQKVETPGLQSGEQIKPATGFLKKGWVLALFAVLFVGASFAWYQYQRPDETYKPPVTLISDPDRADGQQSVKPVENDDISHGVALVANGSKNRQRTPVETYQQPAKPTNNVTKAANSGNKKPAATKQTANKPATSNQAISKQANNKQVPRKQTSGKQTTGKPVAAKKSTTEDKPFRPQPPAPISYWELPDAIRAKVPEMKFSVLVYSKDPADRFVLINGERFGQGEEVQAELFVREIRRSSVVFKYRLYKFLVER